MIRATVLTIGAVSLLTGIAFSTGTTEPDPDKPADEAVEAGTLEEEAPIVDGVFAEEDPVEEADSKSAKIDKFYDGLTSENVSARLAALYSPSVQFSNPFVTITGTEAVQDHYVQLYANMTSFELEITEEFLSGQETVLIWEANFVHPKLKGGEKVMISGVSHLTFANDLIISQKDYFDAGAVVYENVTLVGRIVKWVKGRVIGS